jgi:hypothetical protein
MANPRHLSFDDYNNSSKVENSKIFSSDETIADQVICKLPKNRIKRTSFILPSPHHRSSVGSVNSEESSNLSFDQRMQSDEVSQQSETTIRYKIMSEIVETENRYVADLLFLKKVIF